MRHDTREAPILKGCLKLLELRRIVHWRNNTRVVRTGRRLMKFGVRGGSDIIAVAPHSGRILAIECKRPGGKPTPEQFTFLAAIHDAGGIAAVIDDVHELARLLDRLERDPWDT